MRNTADVDLLLRREDLEAATAALTSVGFISYDVAGVQMYLDGPNAGPRDALHILFAGEKVRPEYVLAAPDVSDAERGEKYSVLTLDALVRMKLTSFRDKDRTHIRDLIGVDLIDASWLSRLPSELASRLQQILDTPEG